MGFPTNFKNSKIYNKFMNCIILILIMISFTIIMICRIKMDFIKVAMAQTWKNKQSKTTFPAKGRRSEFKFLQQNSFKGD